MDNAARFTGFLVAVAALAVSVWAFPQTAASALQSPSLLSAASVAAPGSYESSDPCLTYSGVWTLDNAAASASGGEIHYSAAAGSYVAMEFEGDAVTLVTAKGPAEGMAWVTIDDVLVGSPDLFQEGYKQWQVPFRYTAQLAGRHVLKVAL